MSLFPFFSKVVFGKERYFKRTTEANKRAYFNRGACSEAWAQDHLDDQAVVAPGEDGGVVVDIRHIYVHSGRGDSGWTAVVRGLHGERVT